MIKKILLNLLGTGLLTALLLLGGTVLLVVVTFGGGGRFYTVFLIVLLAAVWLYLLTQIWQLSTAKIRRRALAAVCAVLAVTAVGYEINRAYRNSFEVMNEQAAASDILARYDPSREDNLTVSLDEPATLRLTGHLPRLDGATALYPVYAAFAKAVYPANFTNEINPARDQEIYPGQDRGPIVPESADKLALDLILTCSGTDGAYQRLITGKADIIFAAGPSAGQRQMAQDAGVELNLTPIGREAFVFFVNAQNPVDGLSIDEIQRIYAGEIKNWRELGGGGASIRAFQRPENSGSQTALLQFMGDIPLMTPPQEEIATGMDGIINQVASYRNYGNAIGYSFLFYASEMVREDQIKLLALDGVAPTRENVANKSYPYAAEFYAVTAGTAGTEAEALIEWILSRQGQALIEKTGYTALSAGPEPAGPSR